ncbi:MAG: hypothetical protein CVV27_19625 [Candidatus Melainabacteria bacterium HGW-Melainabacteria-1]|nr:MAG: hypothetical protein CVV27_19625 [Candidatus Melainabacteria bacterium HGW-Melainabacteria-1]
MSANTSLQAAIQAENLSARYGRLQVYQALSFSVETGSCVALVGANGAGKSTLLRQLVGQSNSPTGRVRILGTAAGSLSARRAMAYAPQFLDYPAGLRVLDVIHFVKALYGSPAESLAQSIELFGVNELLQRPADRLSGGEAKRVSLSLALGSNTPILLLDEPAASLDPVYQRALAHALRALRGSKTILFVSHDLPASLQLADRLLQLEGGQLRQDLNLTHGQMLARMSFEANDCPPLPGALEQRRIGRHWEVRSLDPDALVRWLVHSGIAFSRLNIGPDSAQQNKEPPQ